MNKRYSFLQLLEGITKFNIIFFIVSLFAMYFYKGISENIYIIYEKQLIIIIVSLLIGKIYQKMNNYKFLTKTIKLQSLLVGYTSYVVFFLLADFFTKEVDLEVLKSNIISLAIGYLYWFTVIWLSQLSFMSQLIKYLHSSLEYKNFYYLFLIFNIAFFILLLVMVSVGMLAGRSLFESIFVILYFELTFLVFHVVVAKAFDYIWSEEIVEQKKVSVLGVYFASILYVLKLNVIDETLLGFANTKNNMSLFAVLILILFWTFFILLFHFDLRYPNGRKNRD